MILLLFMIVLPPLAELTLPYKLSDATEPSLDTSLLGVGLFVDHVLLKHTWNICFALCLLLMVAWLSAWATRCIPAAEGCCSVKIPDKLTALLPSDGPHVTSLFYSWLWLGNTETVYAGQCSSDVLLLHTQKQWMGNGSALFSKGVVVLEWQKYLKMVPSGIPDCSETTSCATVYAISDFYVPLLGPIVHLCVCVHLWVFNTAHSKWHSPGILVTRVAVGSQRESQVCFSCNTSTGSDQMGWVEHFCM